MERKFDLNIEEILENWEIHHAIREFIANAIDERALTGTKDISVFKEDGKWHIRDYGRGLQETHLTQNENVEKLDREGIIGRFGVGLKDAMATLYRHHVEVMIKSRFMTLSLLMAQKSGFENIQTLHAVIEEPIDCEMVGTDVVLSNCPDEEVEKAKSHFLIFNDSKLLEETKYGGILQNEGGPCIYINGVRVAEEENFLFSYNITSLTAKLKKALNRERANVGRSAYADRVKDILLQSKSYLVIERLISDLNEFGSGNKHAEMEWQEVQMFVAQKMSETKSNHVFVTSSELENSQSVIDQMKKDGQSIIVVSEKLAKKMEAFNETAADGKTLTTTSRYIDKSQEAFKPKIVPYEELTKEEKAIYDKMGCIFALIGGKPMNVHKIEIAETLYDAGLFHGGVLGLWREPENRILIKRTELSSLPDFCGTLLHECAHAISGKGDVSREFENELTQIIGKLAAECAAAFHGSL